jgi:3,4-dihydroxy 2-butanone 4-phosphate synthase/GTP cyclohydrolase II
MSNHPQIRAKLAPVALPTKFGRFTAIGYEIEGRAETEVALIAGEIGDGRNVVVRLHSECLTGDALGSIRCDCGAQRDFGMQAIATEGRGVFLYLRQEGRGIGLANKLRAYALQDTGSDTVDANLELGLPEDQREYALAASILKDLGVQSVRIITNNPAKIKGLQDEGIVVLERLPALTEPNASNEQYLETKRVRMGHLVPKAASNHQAGKKLMP